MNSARTDQAFASLLSAPVVVRELRPPVLHVLSRAAEARLVEGAVPSRRLEMLAGRECAHAALARLGQDIPVIGRGSSGQPLWPDNVVGTITHCTGFVAAAAAMRCEVHHLGIDAEPWRPLPPGVLPMISTAGERREAQRRFHSTSVPWDLLLFCAKEACYKALFPSVTRWIDFAEAFVIFDEGSRFSIHLDSADLPRTLSGQWRESNGLALVAVAPVGVLTGGACS